MNTSFERSPLMECALNEFVTKHGGYQTVCRL